MWFYRLFILVVYHPLSPSLTLSHPLPPSLPSVFPSPSPSLTVSPLPLMLNLRANGYLDHVISFYVAWGQLLHGHMSRDSCAVVLFHLRFSLPASNQWTSVYNRGKHTGIMIACVGATLIHFLIRLQERRCSHEGLYQRYFPSTLSRGDRDRLYTVNLPWLH